MQRKIIITYVVAGLLLLVALLVSAVMTRQSVVSVQVLDKRLTIYDIRLFAGAKVNYLHVPPFRQPQYQCQRVLDSLGLALPWQRYYPELLRGQGPALVTRGRIEGGDASGLYLEPEGPFDTIPHAEPHSVPILTGFAKGLPFIWDCPLRFPKGFGAGIVTVTNGVFHMKQIGESNDLAIICIR